MDEWPNLRRTNGYGYIFEFALMYGRQIVDGEVLKIFIQTVNEPRSRWLTHIRPQRSCRPWCRRRTLDQISATSSNRGYRSAVTDPSPLDVLAVLKLGLIRIVAEASRRAASVVVRDTREVTFIVYFGPSSFFARCSTSAAARCTVVVEISI